MAKSLVHRGVTTPVHFIQASRNSRVHALAGEIRALRERGNIATHVIYDDPLGSDVAEGKCDSVGTLSREFLRSRTPYREASFFFCGPKPFMQAVYSGLKNLGVDDDRIRFEFFGPRQEITAPAAAT